MNDPEEDPIFESSSLSDEAAIEQAWEATPEETWGDIIDAAEAAGEDWDG